MCSRSPTVINGDTRRDEKWLEVRYIKGCLACLCLEVVLARPLMDVGLGASGSSTTMLLWEIHVCSQVEKRGSRWGMLRLAGAMEGGLDAAWFFNGRQQQFVGPRRWSYGSRPMRRFHGGGHGPRAVVGGIRRGSSEGRTAVVVATALAW